MSVTIPNVPNLPGVPPLTRRIASAAVGAAPLLALDFFSFAGPDRWAIHDDSGAVAVEFDSFLSLEYLNRNHVSDYPVEQGQFQTYNKVATPFDAIVSIAKGGSVQDRQTFWESVERVMASMKLYTLVTPELTYGNLTAEQHRYERRVRNGAHLAVAHIRFKEVRNLTYKVSSQVPVSAQTSSLTSLGLPTATAKAPEAKGFVNRGLQMAGQVLPRVQAALSYNSVAYW